MPRNLPQDIRPMGTNNLNQLVHHHLGSNSYDIVANIQANLLWLKQLHDNLPTISSLSYHGSSLTEIAKHIKSLSVIHCSLPALNDVYQNLNLIVEASKVNKASLKVNTELNERFKVLTAIISKEGIEHLLNRYETVEKELAKHELVVEQLNQNTEDISNLNKLIVHLQASDSITQAQFSGNSTDIEYARILVQRSIDLGNDETLNLRRLESL